MRMSNGVPYDIKSGNDILDANNLNKKSEGRSGIFHCAAKISVPESFSLSEEYHRTNVDGTRTVVDVAQLSGSKIVFSSSAAVYGDANLAVNEESEINPKSPYAQNKIDGEKILKSSSGAHVALRYFNVYGPGQSAQYAGVITSFIKNALSNVDLTIYGDGNQVRDFVFVEDVARANLQAMELKNKTFEVFNIGSGRETTIKELAETIIRLTGSKSKIKYLEPRQGDITYSLANVSKAESVLGWRAEVSLEEGLEKTIAFYKDQI